MMPKKLIQNEVTIKYTKYQNYNVFVHAKFKYRQCSCAALC